MSVHVQALAQGQRLQSIMRAHGVQCVIDLMPDSGGRWLEPMTNRVAEMSHHIYSSREHGLTRFYQFVRAGDPSRDLPGPLANGYGGWDEVYRIVTLGRANHPGRGGPLTVAGKTIPKDNARPYVWGTEYEGGMKAEDWTPSYRAFMARANAAILEWLGLPVEAHVEHSTWAPGRKSDRLSYTAAIGRLEIARTTAAGRPNPPLITPPTPTSGEDDLMAALDDILKAIADLRDLAIMPGGYTYDQHGKNQLDALSGQVDELRKLLLMPGGYTYLQHARNQLDAIASQVQSMTGREVKPVVIDVDEAKLAKELAPFVSTNIGALTDVDVQRLAKAAADESDRRDLERLKG